MLQGCDPACVHFATAHDTGTAVHARFTVNLSGEYCSVSCSGGAVRVEKDGSALGELI